MYTEEYERRGFPFRRFLIKLILTILFLLLLFWLLTRFVIPAFKGTTNKNNNNISNGLVLNKKKTQNSDKNKNKTATKSDKKITVKSKDKTTKEKKTTSKNKKKKTKETTNTNSKDNTTIEALSSQIFSNNIDKMKESAISYYTDERLPQEVGQSDKMTLSDMIGKKIIVPLIDKNNKACDVEKSYVKITKVDEGYILKVNIKDSEKEDYILVHLGCYTYCKSYICQKENTTTVTKSSKVTDTVPIKGSIHDGEYVPSKTPSKTEPSNTTPAGALKCRVKSGIYYGKKGNVVDKNEYKKQCLMPEAKYYCRKYNGKYYGKNGEIVTLKEYKKECIKPEEKHYCVKYNGKYYGKDGSVITETEYKKQCTKPEEKHYCVKYNGKYYGKDGSVITETEYKKQCIKTEYVYEYKKTTNTVYSNWTSWSDWSKTSCSTKEINCSDESSSCLKKLQLYKRKEKIGDHKKTYTKTREVIEQTGFYQEKSCSKYNYIEINKTIYATTSSYIKINDISSATAATTGSWRYNGRASYSNPPRDTNTTHYKFVGADYSYCSETCETLPNYYYDSYTYVGGLTSVSSTTKVPSSTSSTGYASCSEYTTKTIPIYGTITVTEKATRDEPLYGDVCYQSTKTRSIIEEGSTKTLWSYYNNRELLDNGWEYTGAKREN